MDDSLENIFAGAAKEFGINENFLKAVAQAESGFDPMLYRIAEHRE